MYQDKTLVCRDCSKEFVFSASEQEFFAQKGFDKPPTRCQECRRKRRQERSTTTSGGARQLYPITCAMCGKQGEVPFQPRSTNVLCAECFDTKRKSGAPAATPVADTAAPDEA